MDWVASEARQMALAATMSVGDGGAEVELLLRPRAGMRRKAHDVEFELQRILARERDEKDMACPPLSGARSAS